MAEARAAADRPASAVEAIEAVAEVTETTVPGVAGPVPVRIHRPVEPPGGVVVYLHGGGHVTGTLDSYDGLTRRLANRVPATVVSVGYRRAPEHRCPAAVEDAQAVYRWVLGRTAALAPGSEGRVVVAGDSAGGNNAAVLVRWLRDAGTPPPAAQVLVYPPVDAVAYRERAYASHTECGEGSGLLNADGLAYWDYYLGPDGDPASPDASPMRAASLAGLPPAYVLTVEFDVLRDEGEAYAAALAAAGVPVRTRRWDGHLHGLLGDPATYDDAEPALSEIADAIRSALTVHGAPVQI
ncbi:alpha/beta hydrolase [Geodermatophilus sp. FMUSA9-8]|uniref:alpha/beta hydrolase n=1 Tax=Geodermatophilus sp. FMUSA9-8 TaxID=3120155 RepID=UPI003008E13D